MAVDNIHLPAGEELFKLSKTYKGVAALYHVDGYAHFPGVVGKLASHEAEQLCVDRAVQLPQKVEHMGLCAASVAAADKVDNSHFVPSFAPAGALPSSFSMSTWGQCSSKYSSPTWT